MNLLILQAARSACGDQPAAIRGLPVGLAHQSKPKGAVGTDRIVPTDDVDAMDDPDVIARRKDQNRLLER